jgi:hypothetical protein
MGVKFVYDSRLEAIAARAREATTTFELAKQCERLNVADKIYLGGTDLWLAKLALSAVYRTLKHYPELRSYINYFGTVDGFSCINKGTIPFSFPFNALMKNQIQSRLEQIAEQTAQSFAKNGIATAFYLQVANQTYSGILVNEKSLCEQTILQNLEAGERAGFSPKGCKSIKYVMEHEIGHLFDFMLKISDSPKYREFMRTITMDQVGKGLSGYAVAGGKIADGEVVAEAYAEYHNNPKPRMIADYIGSLIDREYQRQRGCIYE